MSAANRNELSKAGSSRPGANLDPVERVSPKKLAEAIGQGAMDPSSRQIRNVEWRSYIGYRRGLRGADLENTEAPNDLTGIALSGGGIRSATFALGVLQALARHDLLRRFDYLSTVSGGGYIGTSLTWLTSKPVHEKISDKKLSYEVPPPKGGFGVNPAGDGTLPCPFPYGSEDPSNAREPDQVNAPGRMLRYLRQHGNYLTPGEGITLTSVIVVLLRGIILNLLVWIPIFAAIMWLLIAASLHWVPASVGEFVGSISPALTSKEGSPKLFAFGLVFAVAASLFALCVAAYVSYSLVTYTRHKGNGSRLGWLRRNKYPWRRLFESSMRAPLWLMGAFSLIASVPLVAAELTGWLPGPSFSLIGLASGLLAFGRTMQQPKSRAEQQASWALPSSWIASFGAAFLLYGVLLLAYGFGAWAEVGGAVMGVLPPRAVLLSAFLLALATGYFVDLNLVTVHRFYRDRLMEAFLPDVDKALRNQTGAAEHADSATLSSMCDPEHPVGPYHIINTNLVLTESDVRTYRTRGGDSFVLSPRYCGSNATGWRPTARFVGDELTVPTAMAVSGAAANPWTASGGIGVTRNPLIGMLMALMNLRLGFWLPNPQYAADCEDSYRANHFNPGLWEVLGLNLTEKSQVCLLSDGGHFENLGLYELIRRRVRLIVACDGTADPDYAFTDLQNAIARVWTDFGARLEFDRRSTLRHFMPSIEAGYPRDVRLSKRAYAIAKITYADGSEGRLVYLTAALCQGLRLQLMGYKGANRDFPDQSTADQFFDEEQFEAYRELGYEITKRAVPQIEQLLGPKSATSADEPLARSSADPVQLHAAE